MTEIYSNKEPLQCCEFPNLRRAVGVEVNQYNSHLSVDLERISVSVNTASFGKNTPIEDVEEKVIESTEWVVSHLEKVIAELQDHRTRLVNELISIRANGLQLHDVVAVEHGVQRIGGTPSENEESRNQALGQLLLGLSNPAKPLTRAVGRTKPSKKGRHV